MARDSITAAELARSRNVTKSYVSRVVRLAFLAPDITSMIMRGGQPPNLDATTLLGLHDLALSWVDQKRQMHLV